MRRAARSIVLPAALLAFAGCGDAGAPTELSPRPAGIEADASAEPSGAPCTDCEYLTGGLTSEDAEQYQPGSGSYEATQAGAHQAWLRGPAGTDFALELQVWEGDRWETLAESDAKETSDEAVSYEAPAGRYRWRISTGETTGGYELWLKRPIESTGDSPSTGAPCTLCAHFSGSVGVPPSYTLMPPIGYGAYSTDVAGTHRAWLRGSGSADLVMEFQRFDYDALQWVTLARSDAGGSSEEAISYDNAPAGRYRFRITSHDAASLFDFWMQTPIPPQEPPSPDPAPCTGCEALSGFLPSSGQSLQPSPGEYTAGSGTHQGWLRGPAGTQFVLELMYWTGASWSTVAVSDALGSEEHISYAGPEGRYRWRISAVGNGGEYLFWLQRP